MPPRDDHSARAGRRVSRLLSVLGMEVRTARRRAGWTQAQLGRAAGVSKSTVSRMERGLYRALTIRLAAALTAAVGLDLAVRCYPTGLPVRDAGHLALLEAFRREISPAFRWQAEAPMPIPGDRRALDARLVGSGVRIGVEAEMGLEDLQALERELALKLRDAGVDRMVLVVRSTPRNRNVLAANRGTLRTSFPLMTREVLDALRAGRDPGANGIVLLGADRSGPVG